MLKTGFLCFDSEIITIMMTIIQSEITALVIPARSHNFVKIDHEIISTFILLPSAESFMKGCCQLQAKVWAQITSTTACSSLPRKKCG